MADTTLPALLDSGTHAGRPAASAVGSGALYACSDHDLIYQTDGSSWATWADLTGSTPALGTWTDYTPTWTATTSNPTLGSTTIVGRYKALDSKTYIVQISIAITTGGAWNAGSGGYIFSLPSVTAPNTGRYQIGSAHVLDNGTAHFAGICKVAPNQATIQETIIADATGSRTLGHNVPITWATGDQINLSITIEVV